jgi:hypothetical protein
MVALLLAWITSALPVRAAAANATPSDLSQNFVTARNAKTARRLGEKLHEHRSVLDYGARCDTVVIRWTKVAIAEGTQQLTVADGWFSSGDVGKRIVVGSAGADGENFATTIRAVSSKSQVTLAEAARVSVTTDKGYIAYGSDDSAAINAALSGASLPSWDIGELELPRGSCGVGAPIELPIKAKSFGQAQFTLRGQGRWSSWLVALAPIRAVIEEGPGEHYQANLTSFGIDGSGLADYGANIQGGHGGHHQDLFYNDNRVAGLHLGVTGVRPDGTLVNPGSWYTNIWEFMADHCTIGYDKFSVMPKTPPLFGILNSAGDSHFTDMVVQGASVANVRDTGRASNFYTSVHAWGSPRYEFWINGEVNVANSEVDGATEAGVRTDFDGMTWMGGRIISMKTGIGFFFPTDSGFHTVLGTRIQNLPPKDYVSFGKGVKIHDSMIRLPGQASGDQM